MRRLLARLLDALTPERITAEIFQLIDATGFLVFVYYARRVDSFWGFFWCTLGLYLWTRFWLSAERSALGNG